jgi:hypothetical protein
LKVFEVPVVSITAYPKRFLTGERPEPAFLISKPFQPAMVSAVTSQALFFQRNSRNRAPRASCNVELNRSGAPCAPDFLCARLIRMKEAANRGGLA